MSSENHMFKVSEKSEHIQQKLYESDAGLIDIGVTTKVN